MVGRTGALPPDLLVAEPRAFEDLRFNAPRFGERPAARLDFVATRDAVVEGALLTSTGRKLCSPIKGSLSGTT